MAFLYLLIITLVFDQGIHSQEMHSFNFTEEFNPSCLGFPDISFGNRTENITFPGEFVPSNPISSEYLKGDSVIDGSYYNSSLGYNMTEITSSNPLIVECNETAKTLCTRCNISHNECTREKQRIIYAIIDTLSCTDIRTLNCRIKETIRRAKAILNIGCGAIGLIGNLLVIIVTIVFRQKSSRCHFLIAGLSSVDFVFSAFQIISHIPELWTCEWLYGLGMCKLLNLMLDLSYMLALGFILLITIERYVGIVHPFSKWLNNVSIWLLISVNVVIGMAAATPIAVYLKIQHYEDGKERCEKNWPNSSSSLIYEYSMLVLYFIIPVSVITALDISIMLALRVAETMHAVNEKERAKRLNGNKRIIKILISILIGYVVLVLPNRITLLIIRHVGKSNLTSTTNNVLTLVGYIPYSFHTAINPIIYSLIDVRFKKKVKSLFTSSSILNKRQTFVSQTVSIYHSTSSPNIELKRYTVKK